MSNKSPLRIAGFIVNKYNTRAAMFGCEPLPDPDDAAGILGEPQRLTALNAVASTFGLRGEKYARVVAAES